MNDDMTNLIHKYLDGDLTQEELQQLSSWIKMAPENAEQFAELSLIHDKIQSTLNFERTFESPQHEQKDIYHLFRHPIAIAASILALISLVITLNIFQTGRSYATLVQSVDAEWEDSILSVGKRLEKGILNLKKGIVRIQFDDGVEVTLQGPAQYSILQEGITKLESGLLTATVPPGAEGFQVMTPSAKVVDLGTAFAVEQIDATNARISVFDGEVEVGNLEHNSTTLLKEGEAIQLNDGPELLPIEFNMSPFEKLWPVSSWIAGSTGAFQFAPPWPRRLQLIHSDENVFVLPEGYVKRIKSPVTVNISKPGRYTHVEDLTLDVIPSGKRVRSYLLHFSPQTVQTFRNADRIKGSISFDRPILGLIVLRKELVASAGMFSRRPAGELQDRRRLELNGRPSGDVVTLSEDMYTVDLDLASPMLSSDLVRVLVDGSRNFNQITTVK